MIDNLPEHRRKNYYIRMTKLLLNNKKLNDLNIEFNSGIHPIKAYFLKENKKGKSLITGKSIYNQHGFKDEKDIIRYIKKANKKSNKKKEKMLEKINWYEVET